MFAGYLNKRNTPISPPPMQKVYCVLWGTLLLDFDNEDDAKSSMAPRVTAEILGVSEWDGKGRANVYPYGFLLVTHTGGVFYVSVSSTRERDSWICHVKRGLECVFANNAVTPFKPSKFLQSRPTLAQNSRCPKTGNTINIPNSYVCGCCGQGFYSSDLVNDCITLLQIGVEDQEKVCTNCKNAQMCIYWLKSLNYVHTMNLHELTPEVLTDVSRFKASFKIRRKQSNRLDAAATLLQEDKITPEIFEELREEDHSYRREQRYEESQKLQGALDMIGEDLQTIINILLSPSLTNKGGRASYMVVILKLFEIVDSSPDLIDFYFPQLLQVHFLQSHIRTVDSLFKIDILQQALLVIAQKYPPLGLKLAWSLLGTIGDYTERKAISQVQFTAAVCLLLQLEMVVTGTISSIADVPTCKLLNSVLQAAEHQKQEIGYEIGVLFLLRRRLQEVYDEEEGKRVKKKQETEQASMTDTAPNTATKSVKTSDDTKELNSPINVIGAAVQTLFGSPKTPQKPTDLDEQETHKNGEGESTGEQGSNPPTTVEVLPNEIQSTCLELWFQLGVGQARRERVDRGGNRGDFKKMGGSQGSASKTSPRSKESEIENKTENETENEKREDSSPQSLRVENPRSISIFPDFADQLDFVNRLTDLAESLRFIDRAKRTDTLREEVSLWNEHRKQFLGWDPICSAGEPPYRVMKILVDDCRVFRTKARAPSMIVCEVLREDLVDLYLYGSRNYKKKNLIPESSNEFYEKNGGRVEIDSGEVVASGLEKLPTHNKVPLTPTHPSIFETTESGKKGKGVTATEDNSEDVEEEECPELAEGVNIHHHKQRTDSFEKVTQSIQDIDRLVEARRLSRDQCELEIDTPTSENLEEVSLKRSASMREKAARYSDSIRRQRGSGSSIDPLDSAPLDLHSHDHWGMNSDNNVSDSSPVDFNNDIPLPRVIPRAQSRKSFVSANRLSVKPEEMMQTPSPPPVTTPATSLTIATTSPRRASTTSAEAQQIIEQLSPHRSKSVSFGQLQMDLNMVGTGSDEVSESEKVRVAKRVMKSATRLLREGSIDEMEFKKLIASDAQFREEVEREAAILSKSRVETAFGESWESKKDRILGSRKDWHLKGGSSEDNHEVWPAWDLRCFIVKSNDDLRQEVCCLQMMHICKEIFSHFGLDEVLWLKPYRIVSTGSTTGIVEVLNDAISLDALKKTEGFSTLNKYFLNTYSTSKDQLLQAKKNFCASLAAYSLFSYLLLIKDRHNGNLLIDSDGHIIHIDFGFLLSIAPGGSFSLETAPFKLTEEMVELLGGVGSPLFAQFVSAFTKGFVALRANAENIVSALQVLAASSTFPCFAGKNTHNILEKLRNRFRTELSVADAVKHCLDLITNSYAHYGTRQYDTYQWYTNGIMP